MFRITIVGPALLIFFAVHQARAGPIAFDNLGPNDTYEVFGTWFGTRPKFPDSSIATAVQFESLATGRVRDLWLAITDSNATADFSISIRDDADNTLGEELWRGTFSGSILGDFETVLHLGDLAGPLLQQGASYWVVAEGPSTYAYFWWANDTGDRGPLALNQNMHGWDIFDDAERWAFRVAVPEPSSILILSAGIIYVALGKRKKYSRC